MVFRNLIIIREDVKFEIFEQTQPHMPSKKLLSEILIKPDARKSYVEGYKVLSITAVRV